MTAPGVVRSLFEAPEPSVIGAATEWCLSLVSGPLVTAIATVAVAGIGFAMLAGRMPMCRAVSAVIGIFIMAGASAVTIDKAPYETSRANISISPSPQTGQAGQGQMSAPPAQIDPYAGASVPSH